MTSDPVAVASSSPPDDLLLRECTHLARTVHLHGGAASADVVEHVAAQFYSIAAEYQDFVRTQREDDDVIAYAVRYISDIHALPVTGTDVKWFRTTLQAIMELAVPNTGMTQEAARLLPCLQQGIASSLSDVPVSRASMRIEEEDAQLIKRFEEGACEHGAMSDLLDLVERLYHGDPLDPSQSRLFQVAAIASPFARQARVAAGIDKP